MPILPDPSRGSCRTRIRNPFASVRGRPIQPAREDSTSIDGGWDFTLTYIYARGSANSGGDPAAQGAGVPVASEPNGGLTIGEALEKQLGLKLETQKRPMTVTVIDHLEQTPTDN
jgi:uncharacterized protein (TIGR03435 family)